MDIYITEMKYEENTVKCYTENDLDTSGMTPAGEMIVDSDNMAFIYLVDDHVSDSYSRVHFVYETWSMLKEYNGSRVTVNDSLELTGFHDEMAELLDNINGNDNYGRDFEDAVTSVFDLDQR